MKFNDRYEIHCVADNVIMLSYLELVPHLNKGVVHNILWPEGIGMVDFKIVRPLDEVERVFEMLDEGLPSGAENLFKNVILPKLETMQ